MTRGTQPPTFSTPTPEFGQFVSYLTSPSSASSSDSCSFLCRSIIRKTDWSDEKLAEVCKTVHVNLEHPAELKLGKILCRLPEVMIKLEEDLLFNKLCEYLYEVSGVFTEFYDACYCIERENGELGT